MKNVKIVFSSVIVIVIFSIIIINGSKQSNNFKKENQILKTENAQLKDRVYKLEKDIYEIKSEQERINQKTLAIQYVEANDKVRFIEKDNYILALPQDDSKIMRPIYQNTLVTVYEKAVVGYDEKWLFVEIPTYDSLVNNRGWIKESDTTKYTREKMRLVQNVEIKEGSEIYKTDEFKNIKNTIPIKLKTKDDGWIQEKKDGYCKISQAGGRNVWVKESSVVYPKVLYLK